MKRLEKKLIAELMKIEIDRRMAIKIVDKLFRKEMAGKPSDETIQSWLEWTSHGREEQIVRSMSRPTVKIGQIIKWL